MKSWSLWFSPTLAGRIICLFASWREVPPTPTPQSLLRSRSCCLHPGHGSGPHIQHLPLLLGEGVDASLLHVQLRVPQGTAPEAKAAPSLLTKPRALSPRLGLRPVEKEMWVEMSL